MKLTTKQRAEYIKLVDNKLVKYEKTVLTADDPIFNLLQPKIADLKSALNKLESMPDASLLEEIRRLDICYNVTGFNYIN